MSMINESEMAKELEAVMMPKAKQPVLHVAPPQLSVTREESSQLRRVQLLEQMKTLATQLEKAIDGYLEERKAINFKIEDADNTLRATRAAVEVLQD
jgi:hypothetical protein